MKKALIAGAASVALAAMPVVGVFAADPVSNTPSGTTITDQLEVNINTACSFKRAGEAGQSSQTGVVSGPTWSGTANTYDQTTYKYSATINPGATVVMGTSSFEAYCNAHSGFSVTVHTPDLATGTGTGADTIAFVGGDLSGEGWNIKKTGTNVYVLSDNATFMSANQSTTSSTKITETATYTIGTVDGTEPGTYSGDVVYTFTYSDPNQQP